MSELLDLVLRAHGGLDRWSKFNKIGATIVSGGGLLPMKGIELPQLFNFASAKTPKVERLPNAAGAIHPSAFVAPGLIRAIPPDARLLTYKVPSEPAVMLSMKARSPGTSMA
jgi:hypothetical protein